MPAAAKKPGQGGKLFVKNGGRLRLFFLPRLCYTIMQRFLYTAAQTTPAAEYRLPKRRRLILFCRPAASKNYRPPKNTAASSYNHTIFRGRGQDIPMRKMKKKLLCCLVSLLGLSCLFGGQAHAAFTPPFEVNAEEVYMVNLDTGIVVYAKNETVPRSPASLTKMMTALLLAENVPDLDGTQITAPGYIYDELFGLRLSTADVLPYETVTARSLLYGMMVPSGNEAASVVADYLGNGNLENFFYTMNARAKQLGCVATNFTNAHGVFGIENDHYSCAYDMYLIGKACYENPIVMEAATTPVYGMPLTNKHPTPVSAANPDIAYYIRSTNFFQRSESPIYRSEVHGIKTGSTDEAGYNLVSTATRNGETYLLVVMGTPYETDEYGYGLSFSVSAQLYDWAFDNFSVAPALDTGKPLQEVAVKYSDKADSLLLYPEESFATLLPNEADETTLQKTYILPESVAAPIHEGDVIGAVKLSLAGEELGTVALVSHSEIERSEFLYNMELVRRFVSSLYFRTVVVLLALLLVAYLLMMRRLRVKQRRRLAGQVPSQRPLEKRARRAPERGEAVVRTHDRPRRR